MMKLVGGMLARNEGWMIGWSARAALLWLDELVVLDHCSTDETSSIIMRDVAKEHPGRVTMLYEHDPTWYECAHRQRMLSAARERGATHYAIVDADEVLTANLLPTIRATIEHIPTSSILQLPWVCLARGLNAYYTGGIWFNNWVTTAFKDSPESHWAARDGYEFHHRHPMGRPSAFYQVIRQDPNPALHQGGLMHFQFVNERRLKAKQFLYQLVEKHRHGYVRADYPRTVRESDPSKYATGACPESWFTGYGDYMRYYHLDREPWQIEEIKRIVIEHPGIENGLDDFGLLKRLDLPHAPR